MAETSKPRRVCKWIKKRLPWLPVPLAVALAIVLYCRVDDPLGVNLASYASAVSSLLLVGVTITYVIATQAMAATAERQLRLGQRAISKPAVDGLWQAFSESAPAMVDVAYVTQRLRAFTAIGALDPIDPEPEVREALARAISSYGRFAQALRAHAPSLPLDVHDAATRLNHAYLRNVLSRQMMLSAIEAELRAARRDERDAQPAAIVAWYTRLTIPTGNLRTWQDLGGDGEANELAELEERFSVSVAEYQRSVQPDGVMH